MDIFTPHTRKRMENKRSHIYSQVELMGRMVETALRKSLLALIDQDVDVVKQVLRDDKKIDDLQFEIDDNCTRFIATEGPVATDLRDILATIHICSSLERIGDHVRHLVRRVDSVADETFAKVVPIIQTMIEQCSAMLHETMDAYQNKDDLKARNIAERDHVIDAEYKKLRKRLTAIMHDNPDKLDESVNLLMLNRFIERVGDHITNMCEWIAYIPSGEHPEFNP